MTTERNVFEIEGLECAYDHNGRNGKNVILRIERLSVPMGSLSIILGLSGSGKSTLIETLGLMNHTIHSGFFTYFHAENKVVIDRDTWNCPSALATIRNRHFSFIFQHDFLMPYYTPEENMLIGSLIQGSDKTGSRAKEEMGNLCLKMGLDPGGISRKKACELSVGQKQRLSFIRAIIKDYDVIFGDEPAGNLDELNSGLLMDVLKDSVHQNDRRSAILVSHDIPLSVANADCLIVLSPAAEDTYEVLQENVFSRTATGWSGGDNVRMADDQIDTKIRKIICEKKSLSAP